MIHKFKKHDINIVLDVNSDSIHIIDDLVFELLDYYDHQGQLIDDDIRVVHYSQKEIDEAIAEIEQLKKQNQLFTESIAVEAFQQNNQPVIKSMCLHIAHDCNIRCKYCFASQGNFKSQAELMPLSVGKKAIDFLIEHSGNRRNLEVDFFGGEPLMNFEVVKAIVHYAKTLEKKHNKNFRFTITTNGILLNDEINDFINEHMDNVVLSIDGRKEVNDLMRVDAQGNGTYDTIVPKFKDLLSQRDQLYYLRGTFTSHNIDFSKDVIHLADLGFESLSLEPVVAEPDQDYAFESSDLEKINREYDRLAEEYIKRKQENAENQFDFFHFNLDLDNSSCLIKKIRGCGAGTEYIAITPTGEIFPCHQFVDKKAFKMGTIDDGIIRNDLSKKFKNANVLTKEDCQDCWAKNFCSGGCHANAYNFNQDILQPYTLGCAMEKNRIENAMYINAKLLLEGLDD